MSEVTVFHETKVPFVSVDWGQTKVLVGKNGVASSNRVMLKITEYLPGYVHKQHVHPEQEEIIFVLSGRGVTETKGVRKEFGEGDVVHIPAGVEHATYNPYKETLRAIIVKSPPDNF